jgi:hypothetical protein
MRSVGAASRLGAQLRSTTLTASVGKEAFLPHSWNEAPSNAGPVLVVAGEPLR